MLRFTIGDTYKYDRIRFENIRDYIIKNRWYLVDYRGFTYVQKITIYIVKHKFI